MESFLNARDELDDKITTRRRIVSEWIKRISLKFDRLPFDVSIWQLTKIVDRNKIRYIENNNVVAAVA